MIKFADYKSVSKPGYQVSWGGRSSLYPWKQLLPVVLSPKHGFCHGKWGCSHLSLVIQKQALFSGNPIADCVVLHGIWAHCVFYSEAISLLCWLSVGVSLGAIHCLSVVFKTFSAIQLLETARTIKPSQTVGKGCKTLSASSRGMQQHWDFPPHMYLVIPNTSPADRNILGKLHSEQAFYDKTARLEVRPSRSLVAGLGSVVFWMGRCVRSAAVGSWNADIDPAGTAGWMLLLSLNRIHLVLCWSYEINRNNIIINFSHNVNKMRLKSELCEQCHLDSFLISSFPIHSPT